MVKLVILVEEPSMRAFLDSLLPRVRPTIKYQVVSHQGKSDLKESIPRKVKHWNDGPTVDIRFLVLHDQDNSDCVALKRELAALAAGHRRHKIRIVVRELESWHLGDLEAVDQAFKTTLQSKARKVPYRDPDKLVRPSERLKKLAPAYQKVAGSREMGRFVDPERNVSSSFRVFLRAVDDLAT